VKIFPLYRIIFTLLLAQFGLFVLDAQRSSTRLLDGWEYVKGDLGGVYEALRPEKLSALPHWEDVSMPHCFNAFDAVDPDLPYYQGPGWYRCFLDPSQFRENQRYLLHFEGAGQKSTIYIGSEQVGKHIGGYDEFTIDITAAVGAYLSENRDKDDQRIPLVVRCDNSRDLEMLPSDLSDFNLYGGLYRYVNLQQVPGSYIEQLHVNAIPGPKTRKAEITISTRFRNPAHLEDSVKLSWIIRDPDGRQIATKSIRTTLAEKVNIAASFELKKTIAWSVDNPALYTAEATLEYGEESDRLSEKFGIRSFEFLAHGPFLLNNERLFLRGTHRHEDHAGLAAAMPENLIIKEMQLMKAMGVNFIRLGHYQQSRIVLDACDSLGILVWEEIPWCRGGLGSEGYREQGRQMLEHMIEQHYNHPSVIIWGLGNENDWPGDFPEFREEDIRAYMSELNSLAHQLDPARKTAIRRCDFCSDIPDIYSPSIWAGWYRGKYTEYTSISKEWNEKVDHFLHVEWGASSHANRHSEDPDRNIESIQTGDGADERSGDFLLSGGSARVSRDGDWSETYACNLIDWHLKEQEKMDWHTGAAYWPFKDFSTPLRPENPIPYMNQKGVVQRDLRPKESYYVFQSYWAEKPMVHIYGHSWPVRWGEAGEKKMVKVYSNCDKAELFLNGVSQGIKYRNSQDFPAAGLRWMLSFKEGENQLIVLAWKGKLQLSDTIVQNYQVDKWEAPDKLIASVLEKEENSYLVEVKAYDQNGVFCPDAKNKVEFSLAGDGDLVDNLGTADGSRVIQLYNGRAAIRVRMTGNKAVLGVRSEGLQTALLELNN